MNFQKLNKQKLNCTINYEQKIINNNKMENSK